MSHLSWLTQAESDLKAAKVLSEANYHSQAVWLAAQAVEKGHKAILVAMGLRYQDKHFKQIGHLTSEVSKVLPEALHQPIDPQIASMVESLEARSGSCRYPGLSQMTAGGAASIVAPATWMVDSQRDVENARLLLEWCSQRVERALRGAAAMKP